jgi:hypothetical protein
MFRLSLVILIISCTVLYSCNESQAETNDVETIIKSVEGGDFRGNDLGDDIRKVMAREQRNIVYDMPDELTCRIPLNIKDSTFYEITYNFNDEGLYVIDLDVYPKSSSAVVELFDEFKDYYDKRYGKSTVDEGYTTWFTQSNRDTDVEITMIDETVEKNRPYLTITFYEEYGIAN